jgi:ribosomal-protein-alanine N-acetyltransferase
MEIIAGIPQLPANIKQDVIETPRLLLKELNPEIDAWIFTALGDEDIIAYAGIPAENLDAERSKFKKGLTTYRTSYKRFLMVEKTTGAVIGGCGFHNWYSQHSRAELGYGMANDAVKGQGFMKEALKKVVAYGFENMGLKRIEAFLSPKNTPSVRLVERLGFTCEGILREHYCLTDVLEDSACYSLLKREYEATKQLF